MPPLNCGVGQTGSPRCRENASIPHGAVTGNNTDTFVNHMRNNDVYVDPKVQKVIRLYSDLLVREFYSLPIRRQLEFQADRLTEAHHNRDDSVCFQIASWHPDLVGKSDGWILDHAFGADDGKITIAREYGFKDWDEVQSIQDRQSDVGFEIAVNTMLAGNLSSLKEQLRETPDL